MIEAKFVHVLATARTCAGSYMPSTCLLSLKPPQHTAEGFLLLLHFRDEGIVSGVGTRVPVLMAINGRAGI